MSHVATIQVEVNDLEALAAAAEEIGCELALNQKSYKWWGHSVGDYPLPDGFTAEELGKCEHAIRVKGAGPEVYEVGVVRSKTGNGYVLLWDFYAGGYGLQEKVGENANRLRQAYATERAIKQLRKQGKRVTKHRLDNGTVRLLATR